MLFGERGPGRASTSLFKPERCFSLRVVPGDEETNIVQVLLQ